MSKKRPKATGSPAVSKQDPRYWSQRLFKAAYTYKGRRRQVRNWSVKIQHLGQRRTFALQSEKRPQAALEACRLHQSLVTYGWQAAVNDPRNRPETAQRQRAAPEEPGPFEPAYWAQRLIHRQYAPRGGGAGDLSARIDHGGRGHYFPLATSIGPEAATKAARIYREIAHQGWEKAGQKFSRELTVAFRWLEAPLAWTYTTIHTLPAKFQSWIAQHRARMTSGAFGVVLVESDGGVLRALEDCLGQMETFRCLGSFTTARTALMSLAQNAPRLVLVNQNLPDNSAACLAEFKAALPETCVLLYSVYEDSEELFRTTPGGAGTYVLRRTAFNGFLEPIEGRLRQGPLRGAEMPAAAWKYFIDSLSALPTGGAPRLAAQLTQREHEVLELLSKGHADKDIADRLGISNYTVHEHVRNIFEKLGAHNRTEAAVKFLQK